MFQALFDTFVVDLIKPMHELSYFIILVDPAVESFREGHKAEKGKVSHKPLQILLQLTTAPMVFTNADVAPCHLR